MTWPPNHPLVKYTSYITILAMHHGPKPLYVVAYYTSMMFMLLASATHLYSPLEWGVLQQAWWNCAILPPSTPTQFCLPRTQYFEWEGETGLVGKLFSSRFWNTFQISKTTVWRSTVSKMVQFCCFSKTVIGLSSHPTHAQGDGMSVAHKLWSPYGSSVHTYYPYLSGVCVCCMYFMDVLAWYTSLRSHNNTIMNHTMQPSKLPRKSSPYNKQLIVVASMLCIDSNHAHLSHGMSHSTRKLHKTKGSCHFATPCGRSSLP